MDNFILIFGDSHIRSIRSVSPNFTFYLGRGRDISLSTKFSVFRLLSRILILKLFFPQSDANILSCGEPLFRSLPSLDSNTINCQINRFFRNLSLLLILLSFCKCLPNYFLLPHSPDYDVHLLVLKSSPQFIALLSRFRITPLFFPTDIYSGSSLNEIYRGFNFTNSSIPDFVHVSDALGSLVFSQMSLPQSKVKHPTASSSYLFSLFFKWNSLFSCYRYQSFIIHLSNLKRSIQF